MSGEDQIERRGPAQPARVVQARRTPPRRAQKSYDTTPDEQGLTVYDKWRGQQMMCATCHGRPCADACPEQWMPDTLRLKAARAGLLAECGRIGCQGCPVCCGAWAAAHPEWVGWELHRERADVRAFVAAREQHVAALAAQVSALAEADDERRIPVASAMAQAMAVVAGQARAEDVAAVYEEVL